MSKIDAGRHTLRATTFNVSAAFDGTIARFERKRPRPTNTTTKANTEGAVIMSCISPLQGPARKSATDAPPMPGCEGLLRVGKKIPTNPWTTRRRARGSTCQRLCRADCIEKRVRTASRESASTRGPSGGELGCHARETTPPLRRSRESSVRARRRETLLALGLKSVRIHAGFTGTGDFDPHRAVTEDRDDGPAGHSDELAARKSDLVLPATDARGVEIGRSYVTDEGRIVAGPMSFAEKNAMRLSELQDSLIRILGPGLSADAASTVDVSDNAYLKKILGTLPGESGLTGYQRNVVADYQLSPLLRGIERVRARGTFEIAPRWSKPSDFWWPMPTSSTNNPPAPSSLSLPSTRIQASDSTTIPTRTTRYLSRACRRGRSNCKARVRDTAWRRGFCFLTVQVDRSFLGA